MIAFFASNVSEIHRNSSQCTLQNSESEFLKFLVVGNKAWTVYVTVAFVIVSVCWDGWVWGGGGGQTE